RELTGLGMRVRAFDPVAGDRAGQELSGNRLVEVAASQYGALKGADALAVVTDWNQFRNPDWTRVRELLSFPVVFDGRNLYVPERMAEAGFAHYSIGRAPVGP
ncbi:MAG: UDP binding domain-containing protein, partial [Desulfovibrionaceae bacterium]|nr:UDP binding domain-containing protein [Desulfovibrionaceae bacterium]